jgi:hypothetical protein
MENLSFVLLGLSVIAGILTFLGAHNSPVRLPNIAKMGCFSSLTLLLGGFGVGMYEPVSRFNTCASDCETALEDMEGEHGVFDVFVSPGRVAYKACHKGAMQADAKAKKAADEANDQSLFRASDPELIEARCMAQAKDRCTISCFHPEKM